LTVVVKALRTTDLYLDARKMVFGVVIKLIIEEYDIVYKENICDGNWIDMSAIDEPELLMDWGHISNEKYKNIKEISFAHAGIDPLEYMYFPDLLPNLEYFDLFGNTTKRFEFAEPNNDKTTYYLDHSIIWNFDIQHRALPFERTKIIRDMEKIFKSQAFRLSRDLIEKHFCQDVVDIVETKIKAPKDLALIVVFDGKHVIPTSEYELVSNKLFLKECHMFYPYEGTAYYCYERNGLLRMVHVGLVAGHTKKGKKVYLRNPNFKKIISNSNL